MYNLCCISLALKKQGFSHRAMRFTQFEKHERADALEILGERALENLETTLETMRFAHANGWGYRISSTLFPLFNLDKANVGLNDLPNATLIDDKFQEIQQFVTGRSPKDFRICFHPDHFNVLCSANPEVVRRTINELDHHAWLMDRMAGENSRSYWYPLNIHMSRSAGDPSRS
jgi:UV DNA damage endonuclease